MSIFTCLKNRFSCKEIYQSRWNVINDEKKKEVTLLEKEIKYIENDIAKEETKIDSKNIILERYARYPNMFDDLPPLAEVGKPITEEEIRAIIKSSWGATCVGGGIGEKASMGSKWDNPDRNIETHFSSDTYNYRIPMDIMKKIAERSVVSEWTHSFNTTHPSGPYACNDYATSFFYEFILGPLGYSQTMIGILCCTGHRINVFIPAEEDTVYYMEPQNDRIWFPNLDKDSSEKKPFQIIL